MPKTIRESTHDMQHLGPFINQVTKRKTVVEGPLLPLDLAQLHDEFERYGIIFAEMREQASVHSTKLARLMGKVWSGASKTMNDLLLLNRKLAKDKDDAVRDQKRMSNESGFQKEAFVAELDQVKLQLTVARAALRDKDALLMSAEKEGKEMASELSRLRALIGKFVEGRPDAKGSDPRKNSKGLSSEKAAEKTYSPSWMGEVAQERSTDVYQLSDQVDELFAKVAHEGQRQQKFLSDMETLIAAYSPAGELDEPSSPTGSSHNGSSSYRPNSFGSLARKNSLTHNSFHSPKHHGQISGNHHHYRSHHHGDHSISPSVSLEGGLDSDRIEELMKLVEVNDGEAQTSPADFEMLKRGIDFGVKSIIVAEIDSDDEEDGTHLSENHHNNHHQSVGSNSQVGLSSNGTVGSAGAGRAANRLAGKWSHNGRLPGLKGMSLPPRIEESLDLPGAHMPIALRELMTTFPTTMRIPSLKHTLKFCLTLYIDKLRYDERCDSKGISRLPLPQFVYFSFAKKFGQEDVADTHLTQLQLALLHHRHHRRVRLLGLALGSYDVSSPPKVSHRDFDILLKVLQFLKSYDAFSDEAITKTMGVQIDVNKGVAIAAVKSVFGPICPDAAAGLANRVATLAPPSESKNSKACDLDHLLELCLDKWQTLNETWRRHYEVVFSHHCTFFSVVSEMQFAAQGEARDTPDKDAVLLTVDRAKDGAVLKNPRRPHRPLEVAMRMRDPFAVRAARAKDIVGSVLGGDLQPSVANSGSADNKPLNKSADADVAALAELQKQSEEGNGDQQLVSSSAKASKWHDIPAHNRRPKSAGSGPGRVRSGGASEEVVLLITAEGFSAAMKTINPNMKKEDIEALFKMGVQESHRRCLASFAHVWRYYEDSDGDGFYHNRWTNQTQWLRPFDPNNFISHDLDMEVFIHICFEAKILEMSPFMALVDKDPHELWEDSDSFLAQQEMESAARSAEALEARLKEEARVKKKNEEERAAKEEGEFLKPAMGKVPSFMTEASFRTSVDGGSFDGIDSIDST